MTTQDKDSFRVAEQAARLARIREQARHGVWALRHEAELQAHWEALGREMRGDGVAEDEHGGVTADPAVGCHPCCLSGLVEG